MNFESIGLGFKKPWDVLQYRPVVKPKVKKTTVNRTREQHALISLETPEQRKERQAMERAAKMAKLTKLNPYSTSGYALGKTNSEVAPR